MLNFFFLFVMSLLISVVILFLNFFSFKNFNKNELIYSIESGFLSYKKSFFFFNLSFFVILLLFILFDIELIFIIFFPYFSLYFYEMTFISIFIFFTLWIEWIFGKMMWY